MRTLNTFIKECTVKYGDFILFQEYTRYKHDGEQHVLRVSKPILAIYLGYFPADQTVGFNYTKWVNEDHHEYAEIYNHVEWDDYVDIIGHWKTKPTWKEILKSYRTQNLEQIVKEKDLN